MQHNVIVSRNCVNVNVLRHMTLCIMPSLAEYFSSMLLMGWREVGCTLQHTRLLTSLAMFAMQSHQMLQEC